MTEKKSVSKVKDMVSNEYLTERVEMMVPRDMYNPHEESVSVSVNGEIFQIQRGVSVMVPRYVKMAWEDSERQYAVAYARARGEG